MKPNSLNSITIGHIQLSYSHLILEASFGNEYDVSHIASYTIYFDI